MAVTAWILTSYTGTGAAPVASTPDLSIKELRSLGWKIEAKDEIRPLGDEDELVRLVWFKLETPEGEVLLDGGTNRPLKEVLEWLRKKACQKLTTTRGVDDPYRLDIPDIPGVIGWGDSTGLPRGVEMVPDPNIGIAAVLCKDWSVVEALKDANYTVLYALEEEEDVLGKVQKTN